MTAGAVRDVSAADDRRRRVNPTVPIRVLQVLLWLLVVSGPVTALVTAAHLSALNSRLETVQAAVAAADAPADTAGVEGFAELFIAAYLGAGEDSTTGLDMFVEDVVWAKLRTMRVGADLASARLY